jgi:alkanesulfonate monooxygenase SsuD/methylene tetrahydromethanopterin reductase-like flavin-dependent oxidoreductase (luciferase family)
VVTFEDYASSYPYSDDGRLPLPAETGLLEPFTTLAFLAALTTRVRLGTAMCLLPQRNPVYTAKEVATLDWLSNGRVDLGIGVGWLREEFEALEVPWERRGARTDDYLGVLKSLWCEEPSSFSGEFYTLGIPAVNFRSRSRTLIPPSTSGARAMPPSGAPPGWPRVGTPSTDRRPTSPPR